MRKAETPETKTADPQRAVVLQQTFQSLGSRLLAFIRRRIRDQSEAEDILQDVFYQLAASYSVTEPIENLTSWLFTVARNRITDWYRKRRPVPPAEVRDPGGSPDPEELLLDARSSPELAYWQSEVWSELAEALDELPEEQRTVFVQHELEGRSFKDLAEVTGVPLNTLLSRKRYAVLFLRERLQDLYDELASP
jgi:RNA polymerase sigma factor (sigma-70 family)